MSKQEVAVVTDVVDTRVMRQVRCSKRMNGVPRREHAYNGIVHVSCARGTRR